jgi:hypothetical protein
MRYTPQTQDLENPNVAVVETILDFAKLADWAYEQRISHFVHGGLTFYPHTTMYYTRPASVFERNWDPDRPCFGYNEHRGQPSDNPGIDEEEDEIYTRQLFLEKIEVTPENHHTVNYVFPKESRIYNGHEYIKLAKDLQIVNPSATIITDHRGCTHCRLDFSSLVEERCDIAAGVYPVSTILEAFWKLKSNKFENHYEWVIPFVDEDGVLIDFEQSGYGSIKMHGGLCRIKLNVDHGS